MLLLLFHRSLSRKSRAVIVTLLQHPSPVVPKTLKVRPLTETTLGHPRFSSYSETLLALRALCGSIFVFGRARSHDGEDASPTLNPKTITVLYEIGIENRSPTIKIIRLLLLSNKIEIDLLLSWDDETEEIFFPKFFYSVSQLTITIQRGGHHQQK